MMMNNQPAKKPCYLPTRAELNEAIADILHEKETATPKEVRSMLLKTHTTWKIPERRVAKFVKRQKRDVATAADSPFEDDQMSVSSTSSFSQRARSAAKGTARVFTSPLRALMSPLRSSKAAPRQTAHQESAPTPQVVLLHTKVDEEEEEEIDEVPLPDPVTPKINGRQLEYEDDNDGKKANKRICAPCEGCLIL